MAAFYSNVRQWGDDILYVGYNERNERIQKKVPFKPVLYVESQDNTKPDSYCYDGTPLRVVEHNSIKDAKEFISTYRNCDGFKLYGMDKFPYQFINRKFKNDIQYNVDTMRIFYFDIEVDSRNGFPDPFEANEIITCLALKDVKENAMHIWVIDGEFGGNFDAQNLQYIDKADLTFELVVHAFPTEKEMLMDFISWYSVNPPDVLSGWYSRHFDIPYLYNRLGNILGGKFAKKLSPWGIVRETTKKVAKFGTKVDETTYDIYGVSELDYQDLYRKYTFVKSPSYALDYVTKKHLNKGKLEYDGSLADLLMNDYQKYVEYNIIDTERIQQLDKALNFMELIIDVSYSGKVGTFQDALGTVKYWEMLIYSHLMEKKQQPPLKQISVGSKDDKYAGAFVKDPKVGKHNWIMSFDLASLYPSIIRQVNIGPETKITDASDIFDQVTPQGLIDKEVKITKFLQHNNYSLAGNGTVYSKNKQSFLSELMEKFFNKRKVYKKKMFEAEQEYLKTKDEKYKRLQTIYGVKQLATKILINSAYGAVGNQYFQYYDLDNAEAVTITGQVVIQWIEKRMNHYLNTLLKGDEKDRIVYIDTDSIYISMEDLVNKLMPAETDQNKIVDFLDTVAMAKLEPYINKCYDELYEYLNNYQSHMVMDREVISNVGVWTGKKRYFMNVQDNEGVRYDTPKFKVMGIEVVKSSTPQTCRDALKDCLQIILDKNEDALIDFISNYRAEFGKLSPAEVSFPRRVNDLNKWVSKTTKYKSGCPIHVRGAIIYNDFVKTKGIDKVYNEVKSGEDIKFTYMKLPNALHENVFAFTDEFPTGHNLENYIDYDTQFEKAFLEPLKIITDILGWKTEKVNDLSAMFG